MHKQMKIAVAIEAIVLACALGFSIFYVANGLYRTSHQLDVLLIVLWLLVASALLMVLRSRAHVHEEMVSRFYLSPNWLYNHEIGYAPISETLQYANTFDLVMFMATSLARMSYGLDVAKAPADFEPHLLVSSSDFLFHFVGEGDDPDDKSVVVDQWKGTLQKVTLKETGEHEYSVIGSFSNAKELAELLENAQVNDEV